MRAFAHPTSDCGWRLTSLRREQLVPVVAGDDNIENHARLARRFQPHRRELLGAAPYRGFSEHAPAQPGLRIKVTLQSRPALLA